mgnify:CR=1 FL=1
MQVKRWITKERLMQGGLLLLPPFTAFYLMQFILGALPWEMAPGVVLANALCIGAVYYLLWAATGHPAVCCVLLHLACGLWGTANYFVSLYRGTPVLPWDLTALETAAAVSGSYSYVPTEPMLVGAVLVLVLIWVLRKELRKGRFLMDRHTAPVRLGCLAVGIACLGVAVAPERLEELGVQTDVWDQTGAYRTSGAVAAFLCNLEFLEVDEPEDLSPQRLSWIMDQVEVPEETAVSVDHPNIVAIMNESWADFEEFGNLSLTESVTNYIRSLDNAIWGHTYTSVFGAGTSASEFEFLTGNSMAFLPSGSIPYQQYILDDSPSLASLLKEEGYRTLAFHPGERTSWQRNQAYPRLGFDAFKCGEDMDVEQTFEHGYVSDRSDFEQIIWEFEHKEAGEPLFLFNVTIQNHGSYTVEDYPAQVQLTDEPGKYPMAEQYLTLVNKTDEAFAMLVDYFSQQEEPTILLMFGDHQPSVEQEFLDKAYGVAQADMTMEQYMDKYRTPFVIWANYPLEEEGPEETSLNFLGQYLLRYAGIEPDPYGQFLWSFQQTIPALTFVGYTDGLGNAYSHLEDTVYTGKIEDYQRLQYVRLFGGPEEGS